ncbi:DUF6479 family protein [Streptomyces maoxianensis]|uniref:DUF6479 family protein n=1 Tax=Streptomyces maoxianensis TaxID=1459942 RepID=A0ABV9FZC4_9ACTN
MWTTMYVVGIGLVVVLIWLVWWDSRRKRAQPPSVDEQPRRPKHRPHIDETREPDDFGAEGERLGPHEFHGYGNLGSRPARENQPSHDDDGGSGRGGA